MSVRLHETFTIRQCVWNSSTTNFPFCCTSMCLPIKKKEMVYQGIKWKPWWNNIVRSFVAFTLWIDSFQIVIFHLMLWNEHWFHKCLFNKIPFFMFSKHIPNYCLCSGQRKMNNTNRTQSPVAFRYINIICHPWILCHSIVITENSNPKFKLEY